MKQGDKNIEVLLERHGEQDDKTVKRKEKIRKIKENAIRRTGKQKQINDAEKEIEQGKQRKEQGKVKTHLRCWFILFRLFTIFPSCLPNLLSGTDLLQSVVLPGFLFTLPAANASKNASPLKIQHTKGQAFPLKCTMRSGLSKAVEKNADPCGLLEACQLVKFACNTETARISCSPVIVVELSRKVKYQNK